MFHITVTRLSDVIVSGSGEVQLAEPPTAELGVALVGSGHIVARSLELDALVVRLFGSGRITADGEVAGEQIEVSGAGSYDGSRVASQHSTVVIDGTGSADIGTTGVLEATVSGVGSVTYVVASQVHQNVSGVGSVSQR